jgi:CO/xanthine dehydrogenase Mo-binding subunit
MRFGKGDVKVSFKNADVVIERRYMTKPVHQGYIEPHACLVSVGADGQTIIHSLSKGQFMVRAYTSRICGADIANIRAIRAEIGGGCDEVGALGQDGDEPRRGVRRHRSDLWCRCGSQARR